MKEINSDISGFYKLSVDERKAFLLENLDLNADEKKLLDEFGYFSKNQMDTLIENVIGSYQLPMGLACNFKINNKDYLIPMVIEEASVVAAASHAAKIARKHGGFHSEKVESIMIGQIQLTNVHDIESAKKKIHEQKEKLIEIANAQDPILNNLGGGAKDLEIREITTNRGSMLILHLLVDVLDAMGANAVNTMAEAIAPHIEEISGGKVYLRIISNLATHRIAKSKAVFDKELLGGSDVVEAILDAYEFALADPYRATTHNKGVMNGVIALALATGNDTRAIESGAHAYAALDGKYTPITKYYKDEGGNLVGKIELPMALGIIGGMTKIHPMAQLALKILNIDSAEELAQVAAALGLAQNLAALRALASEGIQKGHMALHSKNIAKLAGVPDDLIDKVAKRMVEDEKIRIDYAKEILGKLKKEQ